MRLSAGHGKRGGRDNGRDCIGPGSIVGFDLLAEQRSETSDVDNCLLIRICPLTVTSAGVGTCSTNSKRCWSRKLRIAGEARPPLGLELRLVAREFGFVSTEAKCQADTQAFGAVLGALRSCHVRTWLVERRGKRHGATWQETYERAPNAAIDSCVASFNEQLN